MEWMKAYLFFEIFINALLGIFKSIVIYDSDVKYHKCNTLDWHPFIGCLCKLVSAIWSRHADAPTKHKHRSYQIINKWLCINFRLIIFHKSKRLNEWMNYIYHAPWLWHQIISKISKEWLPLTRTVHTAHQHDSLNRWNWEKTHTAPSLENRFSVICFEMFLSLFCHLLRHMKCASTTGATY